MMPLSQIVQTPLTPEDLQRWSFAHMANHLDIIRRIYETTTPVPPATTPPPINLNPWPLYPFDPDNLDQWLYQHAIMHVQMDAVLAIDGYNLLDLDWRDPDQLREWISFNANEHTQASRLLEIA
jgi:hypothetical protein